ncbi:MAG: hypothetical protein K2K45_05175 [Muribaculaceae bacterium]|nr:hypothetical protein [Muribaculaceae bacterium]
MTNFDKKLFAEWSKAVASVVIMVIMLLLACVMCGCRTRYVPVETVRTEYKDRVNTEYVTDSVVNDRFVYINGDTVFIYKWRDRWRTEIKHDSIYINKTDTISVPYPVEKIVEVERDPAWWELGLMAFGGVFLLLIGYVVYLKCRKGS